MFPTAPATISFNSMGYLDDNTCHAECTVQFWWTDTSKVFKNAVSMGWVLVWWRYMTRQLLSVQIHLSDEDIWLSNYYLYKFIYHLHYSDCAGYKSSLDEHKSISSLDEQSLLSSVSLFSHSPSTEFMCIIMLSMTHGTTLSLSKYSFWIFSTCFQHPCSLLVILCYKSQQDFSNL